MKEKIDNHIIQEKDIFLGNKNITWLFHHRIKKLILSISIIIYIKYK